LPWGNALNWRTGFFQGSVVRIVVVVMLVLILISLGSALFFLFADRSGSDRAARALTGRVSLSLLLFALLMGAHYFGLIGERL